MDSTNNNKDKLSITEQVMQNIHTQNLHMRPKIYFVIGAILTAISVSLLFGAALALFNLISFRLRADLPFDYLAFGAQGVQPFFHIFPWLLIGLAIGLLIIGVRLLKKYDFSYKHNFLLIAGSLCLSVLAVGIVTDWIGFNEPLRKINQLKPMYSPRYYLQENGRHWIVGQINTLSDGSVEILTPGGEIISVTTHSATMFPGGCTVNNGDFVRMVGNYQNERFEAIGIRTFRPRIPVEVTPPQTQGIRRHMPMSR